MKNLINATRLLKSMHTDLCAGIRCKNCTMCTDDGGCAVEEWIDKFPSAEQTEPNPNANQHVQHVEYVEDGELKRCRECKHCVGEYRTPISAKGICYTYITCTANGCNYEQTEPQTENEEYLDRIMRHDPHKDWYASEDEPQTDCAWK